MSIREHRPRRGTFPEWEINIEGKVVRGRFSTLTGAINSAVNKYPNINSYTDLVIHAKKSADPDVGAVWDDFCSGWRKVGLAFNQTKQKKINDYLWHQRQILSREPPLTTEAAIQHIIDQFYQEDPDAVPE